MTAATPNEHVTKEELDYACKILSAFGKVEVVTEHMMDAVVAVSGSSPAYVFMFIERWQMLLLQRECREHRHTNLQHRQFLEVRRWFLKQESIRENSKTWYAHRQEQRVEAVGVLEEHGFRSAVIDAMKACVDVAKGM